MTDLAMSFLKDGAITKNEAIGLVVEARKRVSQDADKVLKGSDNTDGLVEAMSGLFQNSALHIGKDEATAMAAAIVGEWYASTFQGKTFDLKHTTFDVSQFHFQTMAPKAPPAPDAVPPQEGAPQAQSAPNQVADVGQSYRSERGMKAEAGAKALALVPEKVIADTPDPEIRNNLVTPQYKLAEDAWSNWMGPPSLTGWAGLGYKASSEVGGPMKSLKHLLDLIPGSSVATGASVASDLLSAVKDLVSSLKQGDNPIVQMARLAVADLGSLKNLAHPIDTLVGMRKSLEALYNAFSEGNRNIYDSIMPAYTTFLSAETVQPPKDGIKALNDAGADQRIVEAFTKYKKARTTADLGERRLLIQDANALIADFEQRVVVQPIFDRVRKEMKALTPSMAYNAPDGSRTSVMPKDDHRGGADWGDADKRMEAIRHINAKQLDADVAAIQASQH